MDKIKLPKKTCEAIDRLIKKYPDKKSVLRACELGVKESPVNLTDLAHALFVGYEPSDQRQSRGREQQAQYPIGYIFYEKEQGLYYRIREYDPTLKRYICEVILEQKIKFTEHEIESRLGVIEDYNN